MKDIPNDTGRQCQHIWHVIWQAMTCKIEMQVPRVLASAFGPMGISLASISRFTRSVAHARPMERVTIRSTKRMDQMRIRWPPCPRVDAHK